MTSSKPVTWFRSGRYLGLNSEGRTESRWHIPVSNRYIRTEIYSRINGLCGYSVNGIMHIVDMSTAKGKPSGARKGDLCSKCIDKKEKASGS
jgi:hypothetical protein